MSQRYFIYSMFGITLFLFLNSANAAIPKYDYSFEEPLVLAADRGNIYEITRLLKNGANINKQDKFGVTALMRAVYRGNIEAVKTLLDAGADVQIKDLGGATALHLASRLGHKTIAEMLLKSGANPNAIDAQGYTPLERAIKMDRETIVQSLINEGADLTQKGQDGLTPSELAFQGNNKRIQQIFNGIKPVVVTSAHKEIHSVQKAEKKKPEGKIDNGIGVLSMPEPTPDQQTEEKSTAIHTADTEQKAVSQVAEFIEPATQEDNDIITIHPASENEQPNEESFDILSWFNNLDNPLTRILQQDSPEKEVAYTAEDKVISSDVTATREEPVIEPEKDIIITQNILPEIVLQSPLPKNRDVINAADNNVLPSLAAPPGQDLKASAPIKPLKNKELIVQAREVPDNFQTANMRTNTPVIPAYHHVEVGSFKSSTEAKNFITAKLPQHTNQAEVTEVANNSYKVTVKNLSETNANSLCTTLASSSSVMNCSVVNKLNMVTDSSFGLY